MTNPYCDALRIAVPAMEQVRDHPEANAYSLLIIALLERGGPMTLAEVAERFATAGVAPVERAMRALQRCKPARAPIWQLWNLTPSLSALTVLGKKRESGHEPALDRDVTSAVRLPQVRAGGDDGPARWSLPTSALPFLSWSTAGAAYCWIVNGLCRGFAGFERSCS